LADYDRVLTRRKAVIKAECLAMTRMKKVRDLKMRKTTKRPRERPRSNSTTEKLRC
jgi:hypothetical protein